MTKCTRLGISAQDENPLFVSSNNSHEHEQSALNWALPEEGFFLDFLDFFSYYQHRRMSEFGLLRSLIGSSWAKSGSREILVSALPLTHAV